MNVELCSMAGTSKKEVFRARKLIPGASARSVNETLRQRIRLAQVIHRCCVPWPPGIMAEAGSPCCFLWVSARVSISGPTRRSMSWRRSPGWPACSICRSTIRYHCDSEVGSRQSELSRCMERRSCRAIINSAMIRTWVLGLWLVYESGFSSRLVFTPNSLWSLAMSAIHGFNARWSVAFGRKTATFGFTRRIVLSA